MSGDADHDLWFVCPEVNERFGRIVVMKSLRVALLLSTRAKGKRVYEVLNGPWPLPTGRYLDWNGEFWLDHR